MRFSRKLVLGIATIVGISILAIGQFRPSPRFDRNAEQGALSNREAYRQGMRQGWWDGLHKLFQSWQSSQQISVWSDYRNRDGFGIGYRRGYRDTIAGENDQHDNGK